MTIFFLLIEFSHNTRDQGNVHFPCSADHEQDWQPYPVDPYSAIYVMTIHTYIRGTQGWHDRAAQAFDFFVVILSMFKSSRTE